MLLRGCLRPLICLGWPLRSLSQPLGGLSQPQRSPGEDGRTDVRMDVRTDGRTDRRTDSPCILQDFVPSGSLRGRCPKRIEQKEQKKNKKRKLKKLGQRKTTKKWEKSKPYEKRNKEKTNKKENDGRSEAWSYLRWFNSFWFYWSRQTTEQQLEATFWLGFCPRSFQKWEHNYLASSVFPGRL